MRENIVSETTKPDIEPDMTIYSCGCCGKEYTFKLKHCLACNHEPLHVTNYYEHPPAPDALPDLVMLVKVLARALKVAKPDSAKPAEAIDYLQRKGLISASDCLRGATDSVGDQGKS